MAIHLKKGSEYYWGRTPRGVTVWIDDRKEALDFSNWELAQKAKDRVLSENPYLTEVANDNHPARIIYLEQR